MGEASKVNVVLAILHCITVSAFFLSFCLFLITTVLHYSYVIWAASVDERLLFW